MIKTNTVIDKIYYDPAGHGSMQKTFEEAKKKENNIKYGDVQSWFRNNIDRTTQLKGYNSFVAKEAEEEYQMDLFSFLMWKTPNIMEGY